MGLALGTAKADVIHLKNGRQIEGQIVKESKKAIVVKTVAGPMSVPRSQIKLIQRESKGKSLLSMARQALKVGDLDRARKLLRKAARAGDDRIKRQAERELARIAEPSHADPLTPQPKSPKRPKRRGTAEDPFDLPEQEAYFRELQAAVDGGGAELRARLISELYKRGNAHHGASECIQAVSDFRRAANLSKSPRDRSALRGREQRCRLEVASRALRRRDGRFALAATAALVERISSLPPDQQKEGLFLYGRACELTNRRDLAKKSFQAALGELKLHPNSDLATYRELARLAAAGTALNKDSPGVGEGWRWMRTRHFAILHQLENDPRLGTRFEGHRQAVIKRLRLRGRLDEQGRIAVFIFSDRARYMRSSGARAWAGGHASRMRTENDLIRGIYLFPKNDMDRVVRHEIAHILLGDALEDALLPGWANEGAAIFAEPKSSRDNWRQRARDLHGQGRLRPLSDALGQMLPPLTNDRGEALRFYVQAGLNFDTLCEAVGVPRALKCALAINKQGPQRALKSVGLNLGGLDARIRTAVRPR